MSIQIHYGFQRSVDYQHFPTFVLDVPNPLTRHSQTAHGNRPQVLVHRTSRHHGQRQEHCQRAFGKRLTITSIKKTDK